MSGALKFESFCIDPSECWMFAGNASGQIHVIDIDTFEVRQTVQAHYGVIQAMAAHKSLKYVAALSTDRTVTIWRHDADSLTLLCNIPIRDMRPATDHQFIEVVHSTSQALAFHDTRRLVVTRTGNAALVELEFDEEGTYRPTWCVRPHGDADLISARYVSCSDRVLSGSIDGQFILSAAGEELRRWQIGKSGNVHWAEHFKDTTYLLASDMRSVARIDIDQAEPVCIGDPFTRDDLEHVTYNKKSGRAYVASFDRQIYALDTESCSPIHVVYHAPFKCRWIKTLERAPDMLLVQCRNGGLYKVDLVTGKALAQLKNTPAALWSAAHIGAGSIVLAGDGCAVSLIKQDGFEPMQRRIIFQRQRLELPISPNSFTKRVTFQKSTGNLFLGRADGDLVVVHTDGHGELRQTRTLCTVGSAIRDLAVEESGTGVFIASEDGRVCRIDAVSGETLREWKSPARQPIWALAYCPQRSIIAASERGGTMVILDADTFSILHQNTPTGRPKRMKFVDSDTLLYNKMDQLFRMDLRTAVSTLVVEGQGNTIEDFIWDKTRRYLIMISYTQNITLCDFESGDVICIVPDQIDYSKGLILIDDDNIEGHYPLDFLAFGRSGTAHYYRVHDEKILALGPVDQFCEVTA